MPLNDASRPATELTRVLLIGSEPYEDTRPASDLVGLVRRLPAARAVITFTGHGPSNERVRAVRRRRRPTLIWLAALARIIAEESRPAEIIDVHVARYAVLPLLLGTFRGKVVIAHFDDGGVHELRHMPERTTLGRLLSMLEGSVYRRASRVVAASQAARRTLIERCGVSPWRVSVPSAPPDSMSAADLRRLYCEVRRERERRSPRPRIVYLGHVARLSGGEIALLRLLEALDGIDAHVILAEDGPLVDRLHAAGVSVEVLPFAERTRDLRKANVAATKLPIAACVDTAFYVLRLARRIRGIRPDLIHTNTLKAGVYGSLAGRLAGVPVVWHVHDRIAPDYLNRSAVLALRGLIASVPSTVIVNSEATRRTLWRARGGASTIPYAIRGPGSQHPLRPRSRSDRFVVGMIGRLTPWKGQHVLIDAFARAFSTGDEIAVIVGAAMFGDEDTAYEFELRRRAEGLGLAGRIMFRGFRADVWHELDHMDVLVHASIMPEPFGQVIVEAMLAGVPVVAAASGGPREIIDDGVDGLLYAPGDVEALATTLCRLRDDPILRVRLSEQGRQRASDFAPEHVAAEVLDVYRRVLDFSGGGLAARRAAWDHAS